MDPIMKDGKIDLQVGDEILVDSYDYYQENDAMMREIVTQVTENSICTLDYGGGINYYIEDELPDIKGKTGRHFPELAQILEHLKEDD